MRWITALNLQQWSAKLTARSVFPELVADLIRASARDISCIRFPSGDKGQVRGFDGFLQAVGVPPYVPDGSSIWEFGVSEGAQEKAEKDFVKRTGEVDKATRVNTCFVFSSPWTWDNPKKKLADWVNEKKQLGEWKDVIYIDGVMLEEWLSCAPAVAARYARFELNLIPAAGVRSTDEFWDEYSNRFAPQLVEAVLLAGREQQAEALIHKLGEGVSKLPYAADAPDEVIAFAIAAIRCAPPAVRYFLEARTLVVDTEDGARQLAGRSGLSFLPRGQARLLAGFLAQTGPTVVAAGADDKKHGHEVLRRPSSTDLGKALEGMGFEARDAYAKARSCGRSLAALARLIPSGTAPKPEWVDQGATLLPALLAGSWHVGSTADRNVLCQLASVGEYAACEAPLRQLAKLQDPPLEFVGDVWALRASVDAFVNLGHLIGAEHLARFADAAEAVFGKVLEPPKPEEIFRPPVERNASAHSRWLRDGMMNTLLHMAVLHEQAEFKVPESTPQEYVNGIVRSLPGLSQDHRLMASLQDQMTLLAEAAPIPFLDALERLLEGDAMAFRPIFEEQRGLVGSNGYYFGVMWGLEVIAWDPELLLRASLCLARLAKIDPGGAYSNRPINSLRDIFLSWAPNTNASAAQRRGVLAHVLKAVPEVAWDLLVKLLPRSHDTSSPTQAPMFREFNEPETLTYAVVWESQSFVVREAIALAGTDSERWLALIRGMGQFPKDALDATLKEVDAVLEATEGDTRFFIWDALRKQANRHRSFAGADWSIPEEVLRRVDLIVERHVPKSAVEKCVWLFDDWMPDVPGKVGSDDPTEHADAARREAVLEVMRESGTDGLIALAQRAKLPQHVAIAARSLEFDIDALCQFFLDALRASPPIDSVVGALLAEGAGRFSAPWFDFVRNVLLLEEGVPPERVARLLTSLDDTVKTWAYVESYGAVVNSAFWRVKHSHFVRGDTDELLTGIERYLEHERPLAALDAATRRFGELPSLLLMKLLDVAVDEFNAASGSEGNLSIYNIEQAFEELRKRADVDVDDVAALEFRYLPVFHARKEPLVLHTLLTQRPRMFMDAVCAVFKPASGEAEPVSEGAERLAVAAYELLTGLHVLPGQAGDEVSYGVLLAWCQEVRSIAAEVDRVRITDQRIGAVLAHAPVGRADGAWPHEAVRLLIERLASEDVEQGIAIERFNMRGVYSKSIGEGGRQERALAQQAQGWAAAVPDSPRTAAMLMRIAENWNHHAELADADAARDALRH